MKVYVISVVVGVVMVLASWLGIMFFPAFSAIAFWVFLAGGLILIVPAAIGLLFSEHSTLR